MIISIFKISMHNKTNIFGFKYTHLHEHIIQKIGYANLLMPPRYSVVLFAFLRSPMHILAISIFNYTLK